MFGDFYETISNRSRTVLESTSRVNSIETSVSMAAFATQILQTLTFGLAFDGFRWMASDKIDIESRLSDGAIDETPVVGYGGWGG